MSSDKRTVVLGLDGISWELVDSLGPSVMKNLHQLKSEGLHGVNRSTIPPVSAPAWVSFATGCNPGKHGCYNFVRPTSRFETMSPITSDNIITPTFYELCDIAGVNGVYLNMPATYPPRISSPMVTGMMTRGDEFVFPSGLEEEMPVLQEYRTDPKVYLWDTGQKVAFIDDLREVESIRFRCAQELWERECDLFFLLFSSCDTIQHYLYSDIIAMSDDEVAAKALDLYRDLDEYVGWFAANMPSGSNLMILSDHGFKAYKGTFSVNSFLESIGMCKIVLKQERVDYALHRVQEDHHRQMAMIKERNRQKHFLDRMIGNGFSFAFEHNLIKKKHAEFLARFMPAAITRRLAGKVDLYRRIDVSATKAAMPNNPTQGIYINDTSRFSDGIIPQEDIDTVKKEIIDAFASYQKGLGEDSIGNCHDAREIYWGKQVRKAPDLVFTCKDYIPRKFGNEILVNGDTDWHSYEGIYVFYGADVDGKGEGENINIYDFAPSILKLHRIAIPEYMDGSPLAVFNVPG